MTEYNTSQRNAYESGVTKERERMIALLMKLGVLRESMFGEAWYVIYTEDGPKDITMKSLTKVINE
jgi:hypothetical protein